MDDAYVIGIRLALEDGVSAGVASIAGDLGMLDRAIASSAAGLERLQRIARETGGVAVGPAPRAVVGAEAAGPVVPERFDVMALPAAARANGGEMTAPSAAPAVDAGRTEVSLPRIELPGQAAPVVHMRAAEPVVEVVREFAGFAPAVAAPERVTTGLAVEPRAVMRDAAMPALAAPERDVRVVAEAGRDAVAPIARGADGGAGLVSGYPSQVLPQIPAAPARAASQVQVTQGDVYLDGARMGRWMADTLARAASRPMGGTTGFDGRMGPAWPGSLQGS